MDGWMYVWMDGDADADSDDATADDDDDDAARDGPMRACMLRSAASAAAPV